MFVDDDKQLSDRISDHKEIAISEKNEKQNRRSMTGGRGAYEQSLIIDNSPRQKVSKRNEI